MSNRPVRVNELIQREISDYLHTRYQSETVTVTVSEVRVSPDLREGRVFVAIVGDEQTTATKLRWLRAKATEIRMELGRRIVLKHMPKLEYVHDTSAIRGAHLLQMLDAIERPPAKDGSS